VKPTTEQPQERSGFWSGALFGLLTGMASLVSFQYLIRILREPRLISKAVYSVDKQFDNKEALAMFIVAENLRSGIQTRFLDRGVNKEILHAGYRNFRESWARDFGFASYGLVAVKQYEVVKDTLEAFFWHQTPEGQLPIKLFSMGVVTRFLHSLLGREQPTERILKPKYISGHRTASLDGHALLIISALHYARESADDEFLEKYWNPLVRAMKWLQDQRADSDDILLKQDPYADWADSVARRGYVLYTNVIYWKALVEMGNTAARLDLNNEAVHYLAGAESVLRMINEKLWRPEQGYFATSGSLDNLNSDGNLLAIAWGLATPEQAESILQVMDEAGMSESVPTRVAHPSYPPELIAIENRIGGLSNYHTDSSWLWLGAWHLIALTHSGKTKEAEQVLERIVDVVVKDQQVNEVHGPDGEPLSSLWYKSEAPLTWNAGMILYAQQIYEKHIQSAASSMPFSGGVIE